MLPLLFTLYLAMDVDGLLRQTILRRQAANGLAIIIVNKDSCNPDHKPLESCPKGPQSNEGNIEILRFATLPIFNASKETT